MAKKITEDEKTPLNSNGRMVNWAMGIIGAIVVTMIVSSFTTKREVRDKAEYSYEAVKRIEEDQKFQQTQTMSKEQFVQYKEYTDKRFDNIEETIDENQEETRSELKDIKRMLSPQ